MLTDAMLRSGLAEAMPAPVFLTAGALSCLYTGGELREVRWSGVEVVRRVYVAVRDHNWGTVPITITAEQIRQEADGFTITFTATHRADAPEPIAFRWRGTLIGTPDGTLTATMEGAAMVAFRRNRIGWCVLHPPESCAGQPCTVTHPDGTTTTASFPVQIAPHQPFVGIRQMTHAVPGGAQVTLTFDGDIFETEDQRNWTDDSYKTYGTPLTLPYPVALAAGDTVRQSVTLTPTGGATGNGPQAAGEGVTITVGTEPVGPLPEIGLGIAAGAPPTAAEIARLRALHLGHLRLDLHFPASSHGDGQRDGQDLRDRWESGAAHATALGVPLLVALFLPSGDATERALTALREAHCATPAPVAAWLVFDADGNTTPAPLATLARRVLGAAFPGVPMGGGTDAYFVHLNRTRPPVDALDFVSWSVNPQVHASDNVSIAETLAGQTATVESARAFAPGLPLTVSPVTLRPRRNPDATAPAAPLSPGTPPPTVDSRQLSLFGAGWTAISVKRLAASGVTRATYYETRGPGGVMERAAGSLWPDAFPSEPGGVFPLYHVLADLGAVAGGAVLPARSDAPLRAGAFAIRHAGGVRLLVANLHDHEAGERVTVHLPAPIHTATVRILDATTARHAMRDPESWRAQPPTPLPLAPDGTAFTLTLPPYAVACVDVTET